MRQCRLRSTWCAFALVAGGALFAGSLAAAAEKPSSADAEVSRAKVLAEICASTACRTETRELRLRTPEGVFVTTTDRNPYCMTGRWCSIPAKT